LVGGATPIPSDENLSYIAATSLKINGYQGWMSFWIVRDRLAEQFNQEYAELDLGIRFFFVQLML
jgi:hypothetical protein